MPDRLPIVRLTNDPDVLRLIAPVLALVLLSFVVLAVLGMLRLRALKNGEYPLRHFELLQRSEGARYPAGPEAAARNFINLCEVPILFYALVPLLLVTGLWNDTSVLLLWSFVALRYLHSAIHLTVNKVPWRFSAYAAATLVLLAAWVQFALAVFPGT